ncbi:MAG: hypothetical protein JST07_03595 [Bacteroidetes bacterium]|nr:hypothetical protein [Bacteroidota bacterium]
MPNKFEKDIETIMQQLHIEPNENVWQNIDAALHEKKKRRFVFWWFLFGLSVIMGIALTAYFNSIKTINSQHKINAVTAFINKPKNGLDSTKQPFVKDTNVSVSSTTNIKKIQSIIITNSYNNVAPNTISIKNSEGRKEEKQNKHKYAEVINQPSENTTVEIPQINKTSQSTVTTTANTAIDDSINITSKSKLGGMIKIDTGVLVNIITKDLSKTDTKHLQKNNKKKSNWQLVVGGGTLSIVEQSFGNFISFGQSYTSASSGSMPNIPATVNAPHNGVQLFAGINYKKQLLKHWLFTSGFRYTYLHNQQSVGKDSVTIFGKHVYSPGSLQSINNYAHTLKMPFQFEYVFNPSSKTKISLQAGASFAWLFSEKWLLTDNSKSFLYADYNADNHFITSLHTGIGLSSNDGFQINIKAELTANPIGNATYANQYFKSVFVEFITPLKISLNKKR